MKKNYKQFYALLDKMPGLAPLGKEELKSILISNITQGKCKRLSEMSEEQYLDLIDFMTSSINKKQSQQSSDIDKLRKRVIASIFGYFKLKGVNVSIDYVKSIAVKAAGNNCKSFNTITSSRLRAIYEEFRNKQKVIKNIEEEEKKEESCILTKTFLMNSKLKGVC